MAHSLPNLLTLSRILVVPAVVFLLLLDNETGAWAAFALFAAAALTDFLDGFIARRRNQFSDLGRVLDPIADKLLVAAVLIALVALDRIQGLDLAAAIVILAREILVAGLREFLAGTQAPLPVSELAKWKTAVQFASLGLLMVAPSGTLAMAGTLGLWLAALLTLVTGYAYWQASRAKLARAISTAGAERG